MSSIFKFFSIVLISFYFISCAPKIRIIGTWIDKEKVQAIQPHVHTIFIAVITSNLEVKTILENDLAKAATSHGLKAIKSGDIYPPVSLKEKLPTKDEILAKIRELGSDGIFTVAVVDEHSETYYVPGSSVGVGVYSPYPAYGYYGGFGSYYSYSSVVYTPGYYATDKTYFLESNLYDAKTEQLLVSMQSKAENPGSIERASSYYTERLVEELEKQGLLKK